MRVVVQRVKEARVLVEEKVVGSIGKGLLILFGVHKDDSPKKISWLVQKLVHLRIFPDEEGKMNRSLLDSKGEALVVSQFTLYGNCSEGRRPDFFESAPSALAKPIYETFVEELKKELGKVQTGVFGAYMEVALINDGPVTFIINTD